MRRFPDHTYTAIDTLPYHPHYEPGQPGYAPSKSAKCFRRRLRRSFGTYQKMEGYLYFKGHNLTYYTSTNAEHYDVPPNADILLRGYCPMTWDLSYSDKRTIYLACDTNHSSFSSIDRDDIEIICFCDHAPCWRDDVDSDFSDDEGYDDFQSELPIPGMYNYYNNL